MSSNETLYFLPRIRIEEEYAKNLSKLSQNHLAGQEEGWATFVLKVSSSKTKCVVLLELSLFLIQPVGAFFEAIVGHCCQKFNMFTSLYM